MMYISNNSQQVWKKKNAVSCLEFFVIIIIKNNISAKAIKVNLYLWELSTLMRQKMSFFNIY